MKKFQVLVHRKGQTDESDLMVVHAKSKFLARIIYIQQSPAGENFNWDNYEFEITELTGINIKEQF